jgi:hypothetical protein
MPSTPSFYFFLRGLDYEFDSSTISPRSIVVEFRDFKDDFIRIYINNIKDFGEDFKYCKKRYRVLEL